MPAELLIEKYLQLPQLVQLHHTNLQLTKDDIGSLLSLPAPMLGPVEETTLGSSVYPLVFPKNQGHETPLSYLLQLSYPQFVEQFKSNSSMFDPPWN